MPIIGSSTPLSADQGKFGFQLLKGTESACHGWFFCEEKFALLASQHRDVLRISFVRLAEKSSFFSKLQDKRGTSGTRVLIYLLMQMDSCDFMFVCAAIFSEDKPERFV